MKVMKKAPVSADLPKVKEEKITNLDGVVFKELLMRGVNIIAV